MKRFRIFLALVSGVLSVCSATEPEQAVYRLKVEDFAELTVVDGVNVDYYCSTDSAGWAVFTCPPQTASELNFINKDGKLTIRTSADEAPIAGMPRVTVYSRALQKVTNSGDSLLTVHTLPPMSALKVKQIGNGVTVVNGINADKLDAGVTAGKGSITLHGKAGKVKLSNVSSGTVDAAGLEADNVSCSLFGPGNIECRAAKKLHVFGAGSGKVYYIGTPQITNRSLGVKAIEFCPAHN